MGLPNIIMASRRTLPNDDDDKCTFNIRLPDNPIVIIFLCAVLTVATIDVFVTLFSSPTLCDVAEQQPQTFQHLTSAGGLPSKTFCVPWERDPDSDFEIDDWWRNNPEYSWGMQNDTHECFEREWNMTKVSLHARIHANQWKECKLIHEYHLGDTGWGADFYNIGMAMLSALETEGDESPVIVVKPRNWKYGTDEEGNPSPCSRGDLSCYFLSLTFCGNDDESQANDLPPPSPARLRYSLDVYHFVTRPFQWLRHAIYSKGKEFSQVSDYGDDCTVLDMRRSETVGDNQVTRYHLVSDYLEVLSDEQRMRPLIVVTDDAKTIDEANEFNEAQRQFTFINTRASTAPVDQVVMLLSIPHIIKSCSAIVRSNEGYYADVLQGAMPHHAEILKVNEDSNLQSEEAWTAKLEEIRNQRNEEQT